MLNVALVGLGQIGKLHLEILSQLPDFHITAVVEPREIPCNFPKYPTIEDCNNHHQEIDLYTIATPNGFHYRQAKKLLYFGKNILIEKPAALHKNQVEELVHLAREKHLRLFSSLQLRFSPMVAYVKKLIDEGCLGKIFLLNVECFWNRNQAYYQKNDWHGTKEMDGGILFTQFSHFIDIIHFFLGEVKLLHSSSENFAHQNCTDFPDSGILQFKSVNTLGSMIYTISTYEKNFDSSITIIAEKGTIKIGGQYMNQLLYHNVQGFCAPEFTFSSHKFHKNLYDNILYSMQNNVSSVADAENSINTIGFIEEAGDF
ncbi:MAG: Gfo/Idh/MocA family oxidoreductase [Flavobacteriaceae bacterium]|jgi:predicted dehydrogenase|nr:Gfo/Idh/MocA family oxidoreductase [Flavobacteriaceae bacterium]